MTRLIEILIALAIVAALFLLVGIVLPSSRHLSEQIESNRKMTIVYDTLNSVRRFRDWNPLVLHDPKMKLKLSGPDSGVGARLDYSSDNVQVGDGSWEIIANDPRRSVTYALTNPQRGTNKRMTFYLKPTGRNNRNVEITQTYDVDYGWDLLGRYAGLYVSRHVGDDVKLGLDRLSNSLSQVPNVDYRVQGSKLADLKTTDVPAENLLVVNSGAVERNNAAIKASMKANMEWIKRSMEASDLVAAGPMRIITADFGRETYTFQVAQPVRKAGSSDTSGDGSDTAASDDSGNADGMEAASDAKPAAPAEELTGLTLKGPVEYEHTEAGRVATGSYTGFISELDNVRNAVRAWAITQGLQVIGQPYEVYKSGIDDSFTANGKYDVYWRLKPPGNPVAAKPEATEPEATEPEATDEQ